MHLVESLEVSFSQTPFGAADAASQSRGIRRRWRDARCHRRRSISCCRPSESPGGRERRMLPAALAICAAEFNKFCLSLQARPVTRSCPAPAGPQDGTQGDGRKDRICSAPCGTPPLTRLPHPPRRREASPRRRGAWQAPPRRGDVLRK